jgi:hypothetical protein
VTIFGDSGSLTPDPARDPDRNLAVKSVGGTREAGLASYARAAGMAPCSAGSIPATMTNVARRSRRGGTWNEC